MMICSSFRASVGEIEGGKKGLQSRPGKSGFPDNISARIHPTDQISIAYVYSLNLSYEVINSRPIAKNKETHVNMISGARYHLVATYSVMNPTASCSPTNADLANPKSQICKLAVSFRRKGMRGGEIP